MTERGFTLVAFHAHPDDEALLTGGTLARAAAEGHRVVLVVATAGEAGLAAGRPAAAALAAHRTAELDAAAAALGCARVEILGYADSGWQGSDAPTDARTFAPAGAATVAPGVHAFGSCDVRQAAERLAELLIAERADVLTTYDAAGGYGHPDHVQVHRVGSLAAQLAGTPVVLEATVDRTSLLRVLRVLRAFRRVTPLPADFAADRFAAAYSPRSALTHRVDVRPWAAVKRQAMAAHVTQAGADEGVRTLAVLLKLPRWLFRLGLGHEWFIERGRPAGGPLLDDVFASLRHRPGPA
ncbi:MAG: LmbE family protein [Frankiales bacterium]|nr:LmbE family protein [Frankiales bacterium]